MPEREFHLDVEINQLVEPKSQTTTVTSNMVTCDAISVAILVHVGLWATDATYDFKLTESDKSDFSNPNDVAATDVLVIPLIQQTKDANTDQYDIILRYTGSKGYIKLVGTKGGAGGSCVWGATTLKGGVKRTQGAIV